MERILDNIGHLIINVQPYSETDRAFAVLKCQLFVHRSLVELIQLIRRVRLVFYASNIFFMLRYFLLYRVQVVPSSAAEGTTCDIGKICIQGVCTSNKIAPNVCPYPDGFVSQQFVSFQMPSSTMSCQSFFQYIITNFPNQNPNDYCNLNSGSFFYSSSISSLCCQECKSMNIFFI